MEARGSQPHRKRTRKACQPCRQRKRRCDGYQPCGTCVRYEYNCYFPASEKSLSNAQREASHDSASPVMITSPPKEPQDHAGVLDPYKTRFVQASSVVAFPRLLGIELSSKNAPRLHSFAWNLGVRPEPRFEEPEVVSYLSFEQFLQLADVYFSILHPIFNFIDRELFMERSRQRFDPNSNDSKLDPVICGVAALGSLFSNANHTKEAVLLDLAKNILEQTSIISSPTILQVTAWVLRTIYLRATTRPHASWLSSCTTMHLIEATGLHHEISRIAIVTPAAPESTQSEREIRRRLFWTAKSLNKMISHEYGRSCVKLSNTTVEPIISPDEPPNLSDQYIALAEILPGSVAPPSDIEGHQILQDTVMSLTRLVTDSDEIKLFKAELALSIYRKMRLYQTVGRSSHAETLSLIIQLGLEALASSSSLSTRKMPWWTVISVPFQLICVLLSIDSRDSLSHIPQAMAALEAVGKQWDTHMVREAIGSSVLLLKLSRKRKEEDMKWLDEGMPNNSGPHGYLTTGATNGSEAPPQSANRYLPEDTDYSLSHNKSRISGIAVPNTLDFIDGMEIPLPEDLTIDWNNFFNNMDWL